MEQSGVGKGEQQEVTDELKQTLSGHSHLKTDCNNPTF